jgi:peptidoglycan/xylan/chitin deacetylase (PgdA/CDA1 family)
MPSNWSALTARVSNRLARQFCAVPHRLPADNPMVSFTFDYISESAASVGAPMLEQYGGRGTFYISGGLVGQWSGHWKGINANGILDLQRSGHEIACHTFSHKRSIELDAAAMAAEIETNRRYFHALDPSIKLENFAYPYGVDRCSARLSSTPPSLRRARSFPASTAAPSICSFCARPDGPPAHRPRGNRAGV